MKINFFCFKLSKTMLVLIFVIIIQILFIIMELQDLREDENLEKIQKEVMNIESTSKKEQNDNNKDINQNNINQNIFDIKNQNSNNQIQNKPEEKLEEYKNMPKELKGYKIIGKIEIPKLNLNTYIINETNKKSLKVSVTKLYGPTINQVGNFCIAGHNYRNNKMFGGIKKLDKGDEIILTDTYDRKVKYEVYETFQADPKDVSALNQETGGEREVTLITCTTGAIKRVIVKAVEVYD